MSIARCKEVLPFPRLLAKLGIVTEPPFREDKNEQVICCPWRTERTRSFNVKLKAGKWFWFDHGDSRGGDEVTFLEMSRACDKKEAIRLYHELAGVEETRRTLQGIEPVLYRLPELLSRRNETVWICEGEKDADCLAEHGCWPRPRRWGVRNGVRVTRKHWRDAIS